MTELRDIEEADRRRDDDRRQDRLGAAGHGADDPVGDVEGPDVEPLVGVLAVGIGAMSVAGTRHLGSSIGSPH